MGRGVSQVADAGVPTADNISAIASLPVDSAALNFPVASAVAVVSAVANVISAIGVAWASALTSLESMMRLESLLLPPSRLLLVFLTFLGP
jgi:hypothetical protein